MGPLRRQKRWRSLLARQQKSSKRFNEGREEKKEYITFSTLAIPNPSSNKQCPTTTKTP